MAPLRFFSRRGRDSENEPEPQASAGVPDAQDLPARPAVEPSDGLTIPEPDPVADGDLELGFSASRPAEQEPVDVAFGRDEDTPEPHDDPDDDAVKVVERQESADEPDLPNDVERALEAWRTALREMAGVSPLFDISELRGANLDLGKAHPSGIAQLYAGRSTRLSSLVRDPSALAEARVAVRGLLQRATELAQRYSSAPIYLVNGLARWAGHDPADAPDAVHLANAPILMRPLHITAHEGPEGEYELLLEPGVEVNPVLVRALGRTEADLDADMLAGLSLTEHGFSPHSAIEQLREIGEAHLTDFEVVDRVLAGPFIQPSQLLLDDLDAVEPLLAQNVLTRALAGDIEARRQLNRPLPPLNLEDREPDAERGVGDLDPIQQSAIEIVAAGENLILDARPGSTSAALVAGILADAAASGRRVVHVPASRRTGRAIAAALDDAGLSDLVLDLQVAAWRTTAPLRLREGMEPWVDRLDDDAVRTTRATLREVRGRLGSYMSALHRTRDPWGISAYDSLQHLAELTTSAGGPSTRVRLDADAIGMLDEETRAEASEKLSRFAILGGLAARRRDTPWYGARIRNQKEATDALERAQHLSESVLPRVLSDVGRVTRETGLERASSLADWNEQLEMLEGVRESLDIFQPLVFERSAADMVIATASNQWRAQHKVEMPGGARRRLVKQAKDMLRPGVAVPDLHSALARVQRQREVWRRHNPAGGWPRLPENLSEARRTARDASSRLDGLLEIFPDRDLEQMPIEELRDLLTDLGSDPSALRYLPELNSLEHQLRNLGLGPLVEDMRERGVTAEAMPAELELAWWASVLEQMLASDPALAQQDGASLNALADSFRELDRAQVASLPGPIRRAVDRRRARVIAADKARARDLWTELSLAHGPSLRSLRADYGELLLAGRPIWIVPPLAVGQALPARQDIDLLVIDGAHHVPTSHVAGAIARAKQIVVVGDTSRSSGGLLDEFTGDLPLIQLPTDRARREEHIASFLAAGGWDGVVDTLPSPPSPSRMRLHVVEGFGMPAVGAVSVEGVGAEVEKVLNLARERLSGEETVLVVSLSDVTAAEIRARAEEDPELAHLLATAPERFLITDVEHVAGVRRDVVILSVGYGKTPHGRVLHRFGPISAPEGLALMVDALDAVGHDLEIVSALAPEDIERDRLHHPGAELLAELLDYASDRPAEPGSTKAKSQPAEGEPDQLLIDLTERLHRLGLTVVPRYGLEGGVRIPLVVGHPARPGELFVGVLTDDTDYVSEPSLRRRDRYWVERLEQHGWVPHMAFSQAVFMDPQREARAIAAKVRAAIARTGEVVEIVEQPRADVASPQPDAAESGVPESDAERSVTDAEMPTAHSGLPTPTEADTMAVTEDFEAMEASAADSMPAPDTAAQPDEPTMEQGTKADEPAASQEEGGDAQTVESSDLDAAPPAGDSLDHEAGADVEFDVEPAGDAEKVDAAEDAAPAPKPSEPAGGPMELDLDGRGPRPDVPRGRPIREYSDDQLDALAAWIQRDGVTRSAEELVEQLRGELGITRRSGRVEQVLKTVAERNG